MVSSHTELSITRPPTIEFFHRKVASPFGEPMSRAQLAIGMLEKESNERGSLYVYLRLVGVEIPGLAEER